MRADIVPGGTFPDYELPDHTNIPRRLSEIEGDRPLILTLAVAITAEGTPAASRAAAFDPDRGGLHEVATIATDEHDTLQEFRASVGARGRPLRPWLHRPTRPRHRGVHRPGARPDDSAHAGAQARARGRPRDNGYWFWGRPSVVDLWHDLRDVAGDPPDWDLSTPGLREAWDAGDHGLRRLELPCRGGLRLGAAVPVHPNRREATPVRDEDREPGRRQCQGRSRPHDVALQGAGAPVVDQRADLEPGVVGGPQCFDVRGDGRWHRQPGVGLK